MAHAICLSSSVIYGLGGTGFKWEILTSKVINEEFFDKVDQAVPVKSLRTQEGHWQTVKSLSHPNRSSMVLGAEEFILLWKGIDSSFSTVDDASLILNFIINWNTIKTHTCNTQNCIKRISYLNLLGTWHTIVISQ